MKKYLKITAVILILTAIGFGIYYFFKKSPVAQDFLSGVFPGTFKAGKEAGVQPIAGEKLNTLTQDPIFDYWINSKTGDIYYLTPVGQVIRVSGGQEELINSQTLPRLNQVLASNDGTLAIAKFSYPDFPTFSIFDTVTNSWQPLPPNTIAAAWSPNGPEISYVDDRALKIFNLASKKTSEIIKLTQKELMLHWRKDSRLFLTSLSGPSAKMMILDAKNKTLLPFLEENGLVIQWSANDELGIKLNSVNNRPQTSLIDGNGVTLSQLTFVTLPSKCLIEELKIYCAVPKNIGEGLKLPEDYYKKAVYFDDTFYLINLSDGSVSELKSDLELKIDAEHLELRNNQLLFKNRLDSKLYSLGL